MKNSFSILIIFLISAFSLSRCDSDKDIAEAIVKERFSTIPPECFLNINIKPRGNAIFVSFPAENRIGYVQFIVKGYEPEKPNKLKFCSPITKIQRDIVEVCRVNNLAQNKLLPLMHDKITSFYKIGVSQVRGINSNPFIAFQFNDEVLLYYVANLPKGKIDNFFTYDNKLHVLNKSWLYEKHEGDILP